VYSLPNHGDLSTSTAGAGTVGIVDLFNRIVWSKDTYNNSYYSTVYGIGGLDYRYPH
jgi:hypothetical protein